MTRQDWILEPQHELTINASGQVPALPGQQETREGPAAPPFTLTLAGAGGSAAEVLVAGVGYTCLSDLSVGPALVERLQVQDWPAGVVIEDLSYGPIDVLFRLQASPQLRAAVFVTAVTRGRSPGTLERRRWTPAALPPDELQARVAEAITGVISLENLLCILAHFGALPAEVVTLEIEPLLESWGTDFSSVVLAAIERAEEAVRSEVERLLVEADR